MKKILIIAVAVLMAACTANKLPQASLSRYQVETVKAVSGDGYATITWTNQANKPTPLDYLIIWTAGNTNGQNGRMTVESSKQEVTINELVNDCPYTFSVQARYPDGLAMKVTANCTPKSTRIPVSEFKAIAGDGRAFVSWSAPETSLGYSYHLNIQSEKGSSTLDFESGVESYLINDLTNGIEYLLELTCVYGHGVSPSAFASVTPGEIDPIIGPEVLYQFELGKYEYNPAYFVGGVIESLEWNFGDGTTSTAESPVHLFTTPGTYSIKLNVKYAGGTTDSAEFSVDVLSFGWTSVTEVGYQKASNVVFSNNGQTLYTIPQTLKKIIAIDAITGKTCWEYGTSAATYGAGPAVGPDGKIYFGTEDADGSFYALSPSGALKWKKSLGGAVKASPAITCDGIVYALADGGKLFAFDADDGKEKWTATKDGVSAGVAVDADGNVYMATSTGVWSFTASGTMRWECTGISVTERGGSIAIYDGLLYATLKSKGGCAAISLSDGKIAWQYKTSKGDCYHPVVDCDGTVYFCEKAGYLFAVKKDGTLKWSDTSASNYIYNGFVIGENGYAYISQYASPFNLLSFSLDGTQIVLTAIGAQTMSPISLGPDMRLYYVTNGTLSACEIKVSLAKTGWPTRGGNMQGTNSLK